jgi:hypothetical protein
VASVDESVEFRAVRNARFEAVGERVALPGITAGPLGVTPTERPVNRTGRPSEWLRRRRLAVLGGAGGTEKVDEQLRDALSLVVMDPVRRVGEALDAVEVG